jgi:DNA-binding NarL/FixJ family response regulator
MANSLETLDPGRSSDRMKSKITVLLVDDHMLVRHGFRRIIQDETDLAVVGEAADGAEAIEKTQQLRPNVVVMDWSMPGMSGLVAAGQIAKLCPETAVLILSMHSEHDRVRQAARVGARGYVIKNAAGCELVSAIRRVAAGEPFFYPQNSQLGSVETKQRPQLSTRELEVLQLIVDGESNQEIAVRLGLSANTVAAHRSNLMNSLHIKKTAQLVAYAIRNGLANVL